MAGVLERASSPSRSTKRRKKQLSLLDARRVFVAAQMRVARAEPPRDATLAFEDWLEALARVADAAPTPSPEDEDTTGFESGKEADDADAAGAKPAETALAGTTPPPAEDSVVPADEGSDDPETVSEEEAFAARSLASKLDGFLEHVLRRAWSAAGEDADAYDAERAADALRGLTLS